MRLILCILPSLVARCQAHLECKSELEPVMHFECVDVSEAPTVRTKPAQGNALGLDREMTKPSKGATKWGRPFRALILLFSMTQGVAPLAFSSAVVRVRQEYFGRKMCDQNFAATISLPLT